QNISALLKTNRDAEERILVRKIGGSVERIDDPLPFTGVRWSEGTGLFCKNRVIGISLANAADDERFGFLIRDGDQVRSSLQFNPLLAAHVMLQHIAAGPSERSEEHTSELQSRFDLVCRLLLEKKNTT